MSENAEARCPCCGGRVEYFPDQDGSCDYCCIGCSWHQHVPGDGEVAELGGKAPVSMGPMGQMLGPVKVDLELLKQQAAILGKVVDASPLSEDERSCLGGLWEFVHRVMDDMEHQALPGNSKEGQNG